MKTCQAPWLKPCTRNATNTVRLDDQLYDTCWECREWLNLFDLYHTERSIAGERAALESWTGRQT